MPRININEKDRTSPGTPGGYSNNTVLIAGFSAYTEEEIKANAEAVQADDNGIFEFESADDFEKTIGLVAPNEIEIPGEAEANRTARLPEHYGNQMAYELLSMGYMVIYINLGVPYTKDATGAITIDAAEKMSKLGEFDDTWAIFKDKASYDFRFVSHGLLTSDEYAKSDNLVKLEKRVAKMRTFLPVFNGETDIQNKKDDKGKDIVDATTKEPVKETVIEAKERIYQAAVAKESAFLTSADTKAEREAIGYTSSILTIVTLGASAGYDQANINIKALEDEIKGLLEADAVNNFSPEDFNEANAAIAKLAHYRAVTASDGTEDEMHGNSGRGDCVALIEVDESTYIKNKDGENKRPEARIITAINQMATDANIDSFTGKYCACTVPSVVYAGNKKFPGAFHYLACYNNSLGLGFAEWYAVAGYTRGVSSYNIDHTSVKLGEIAIQALEPRNYDDPKSDYPAFACNVIANFRGSYYLWGNRTAHPLGKKGSSDGDLVASHFLNIRQLCTTIKKQLYVSCRRFTFDPNSETLWINFYNSITPMLNRMRADQGIRSYKIERVYTDKKATVKARIRIVPIEAVEDFILEIALEDSLGEAAVTVTE